MTSKRRLVAATGGMAVVTIVSRISGLMREKVVAALLGAGMLSDAFLTALRIPNMFRAFLAEGAMHAAFIPALADVAAGDGSERPRRFVRSMFSMLLSVLPVVVVIGVVAAPWLVKLFAESFTANPAKYALTVRLTRLMFPYLGLISLAALAQGVLNASDRFLLPAATPIALNICIVAGTCATVWLFGGRGEWMAAGVLAGGLVQFAMQWNACRRVGLPLLPGRGFLRDGEVHRVLALMLPGVPAMGIYQVTLLLSNRYAAAVGEGAVTCVYQAARINELVYGVLIVQLTTAVLPMLSAQRSRSPEAAREMLGFAMRVLSAVAWPAAAFTLVAAVPLVGSLLGGGKYGAAAVHATAAALVAYALGMPFLGLAKLLSSVSYAWRDTRTPLITATVNLGVFIVAAWLLTPRLGVAGVAGAASLGQFANAAMLVALNARGGRLPAAGTVVPAILRHILAAAVLAVAVSGLQRYLPTPISTSARSLATVGVYGLVALTVYAVVLIVTGAPEIAEVRKLLTRGATG